MFQVGNGSLSTSLPARSSWSVALPASSPWPKSRHHLLPIALGFDEVVADGVANQIRCRAQIQFMPNLFPVALHGLEAETEDGCDLLVAMTFGNELHHAALAGAQRA